MNNNLNIFYLDQSRSSNVLSKDSQSNLPECNGDLAICGKFFENQMIIIE